MRFLVSFVIPILAMVSSSLAYSITARALIIEEGDQSTYESPSDNVDQMSFDSPKSRVSIAVKLDSETQPHQLIFLLTDGNGLDHAIFPEWQDDLIARTLFPLGKLPPSLLEAEKIDVVVIAADDNEQEPNLAQRIAELKPSEAFKNLDRDYKEPTRLGAKPEIHHIFRSEEATVNPIVPIIFSVVAGFLLLALLTTWTTTLGDSMFGSLNGSSVKTVLLVVLASFEYTFIKYYLGATIFTTIFHIALLTVPALIVGSKALSLLAKARSSAAATT